MAVSNLVYIDETGYHFADYPTFLEYLQDEYRAIYGPDVYLESDSQDGQLISVFAQALFDTAALGASVYNAFSPSTAQGVGLSRNVKINGIRRKIATNSSVDLVIIGQVGTTINNGQVDDTLGQRWLLPTSVVIPLTGTITVTAIAEGVGDISAAANTVNKIATPTLGWQSVNNPLAAVEGAAVETDFELRQRQRVSTALPSLTVLDGTIGAVANIEGVTRYRGYENDTNITDGDGIPPHSISLVVEGGDTQAIGDTIALKKTPGTGTYGTTSVLTTDQYGIPNTINFFRPTNVPITIEITLQALPGYTTGYEDQIKSGVAAMINGLRIGDDVYISKIYTPANLPGLEAGGTYDIVSIEISRDGDPVAPANLTIAFNEAATSDVADITVTVMP